MNPKQRLLYFVPLDGYNIQNLNLEYLSFFYKPEKSFYHLRLLAKVKPWLSFKNVPRTRLKWQEDQAFSVIGPKLWNSLPLCVKAAQTLSDFKSLLKLICFLWFLMYHKINTISRTVFCFVLNIVVSVFILL